MRCSAAFAVLLAACSVDDGVLGGVTSGTAGNGGAAGSAGQCGPGPVVTLPARSASATYSACTGRIAAAHFLNALCSCSDARFGNFLQTRGFDSSRGAFQIGQPDDSGASVGVNGAYILAAGSTDVGGSLSLAGSQGPSLAGSLQVRGDFRCAGDVTVTGTATVARNAWLTGDLVALGSFNVEGELHHQGSVRALLLTSGSEVEEPVVIERPCACEPSELLDVANVVESASANNDNALAGFGPNDLSALTGPTTLELPCGRYFFERIAGSGPLTLAVSGQTALFVRDDIELSGALEVRSSAGAELDVFVAGDLDVSGPIALAQPARPAAGRIYVGGSHEIEITSPWVGNLYAPKGHVSASAPLEVWGSIFAAEFSSSASASFVFDRAVLNAGSACGTPNPPAGSCSRCGWCSGGTACVDGVCGACRSDADCCSQSVCSNGSCVALVEVR